MRVTPIIVGGVGTLVDDPVVKLIAEYHVNVLKKTPAGAEEYADVDVERELAALEPGESVRAAFERRPGQVGTPEK